MERYVLDSTSAVQVSGKLEKYIGRQISPGGLFDYPTIDLLVQFLCEAGAAETVRDPADP
ncbi:acyl carrier protein [Mycobacterium shigaense]|uniref:acyl carrier protein n=1 Tax=Mycobacterium shigaense TaxID=722731 RepID=UPI002AE03D7A|nr:acyl carrier protein [Mycobacterium shigaense]MEA1121408.1 acyl carrier protein [Mycobacterium shigaense]